MDPPTNLNNTSSRDCDAHHEQILWRLWSKAAEAEENTKFLSMLRKRGLGTGEMEAVIAGQLRGKKRLENYKRRDELLNILYGEKLDDARAWEKERRKDRNRVRKEIEDKLGVKSRKYRNLMREIKSKVEKLRQNKKEEYEKRIKWLDRKYRKTAEYQKRVDLPWWLERYKNCKIFSEACQMAGQAAKGPVIIEEEGKPIPFSDREKAALALGPKFCTFQEEDMEDFMTNVEICFAKYKWDKMGDEDEDIEEDLTDEEIKEKERIDMEAAIIESEARTVFQKDGKNFDYSRKRATDIKQNTRVHLPKARSVEEEAALEALRQELIQGFKEHCKEGGKQVDSNLTKEEKEGLESVRKRRKSGELVILPTDKSGRFCVMTLKTYLEAGLVHTAKDKEASQSDIKSNQSEINGHVSMILKIFCVAGKRGQEDRARETMINNSQTLCPMYLVFKDHKNWTWSTGKPPPTRPIAGGNAGQNVHLSELNSEIIEAVVEAYEGGVEVISTEDMNAQWEIINSRNKNWTPGTWWEGVEDDLYVTCGRCWESEEDFCNCIRDEKVDLPEGWNKNSSHEEGQGQNDNQNLNFTFNFNKKNYKKSQMANKKTIKIKTKILKQIM